jgi:hypothetical protein
VNVAVSRSLRQIFFGGGGFDVEDAYELGEMESPNAVDEWV